MTKQEFEGYLKETLGFAALQPERFNAALGVRYMDCGVEPAPFADFLYQAKEEHRNPYGGIHGGIISSLVDYCTGTGAVAVTRHFVTTVDLSVSYLRALNGENFRIRVEYTHVGGRMISALARVIDLDSGELCATSQLNFMQLAEKPRGLAV